MDIPATSDVIPGTTVLRDATGRVSAASLRVVGMTAASRDALTGVSSGTLIYNSSTNKLNFYNGTAWEAITSV